MKKQATAAHSAPLEPPAAQPAPAGGSRPGRPEGRAGGGGGGSAPRRRPTLGRAGLGVQPRSPAPHRFPRRYRARREPPSFLPRWEATGSCPRPGARQPAETTTPVMLRGRRGARRELPPLRGCGGRGEAEGEPLPQRGRARVRAQGGRGRGRGRGAVPPPSPLVLCVGFGLPSPFSAETSPGRPRRLPLPPPRRGAGRHPDSAHLWRWRAAPGEERLRAVGGG